MGREMAKPLDKEEKQEKKQAAIREARFQQEFDDLQEENRYLKQKLTRWCENCRCQCTILGAQSCPDCGATLIREKFCNHCASTFSPRTGYKYCPYCKDKIHLCSR
jgi:hypothetical protein